MGKKDGRGESSDGARGAESQDGNRGQSDGTMTPDDVRSIIKGELDDFATGPLNKALNDHRKRVDRMLDDRLGSSDPSTSSDSDRSPASSKTDADELREESPATRQMQQRIDELEKRDRDREAEFKRREREDRLRALVEDLDVSDPKEFLRRLKGDDGIKVDEETNEFFFEVDGKVHKAADYAAGLVKSSPLWQRGNTKEGGGPTPGPTKAGATTSDQLAKLPTSAALGQIYQNDLQNKG